MTGLRAHTLAWGGVVSLLCPGSRIEPLRGTDFSLFALKGLQGRLPGLSGLRTLFLCLVFLPALALAQDPPSPPDAAPPEEVQAGVARLEIDLDREEVTVGGRLTAELTLVWMGAVPADEPRFPTWQDTWGNAEILAQGDMESFVDQSGRRIYRQALTLTAFEVGEVRLPPVTVTIPLEDRSEDVSSDGAAGFSVRSVLPGAEGDADHAGPGDAGAGDAGADDADAGAPDGTPLADDAEAAEPLEPRPTAPPLDLERGETFYWTAGLLAVAAILAALALLRRLGLLPDAIADLMRPRKPPLEELLNSLDRVDPRTTASEPAHTVLSQTLRRYLGRRLGFQAMESTTSEIQRTMRSLSLPLDESQLAVRLLQECDRVKFARQEVSALTTEERFAQAKGLARSIEGRFVDTGEDETTDDSGAATAPRGSAA